MSFPRLLCVYSPLLLMVLERVGMTKKMRCTASGDHVYETTGARNGGESSLLVCWLVLRVGGATKGGCHLDSTGGAVHIEVIINQSSSARVERYNTARAQTAHHRRTRHNGVPRLRVLAVAALVVVCMVVVGLVLVVPGAAVLPEDAAGRALDWEHGVRKKRGRRGPSFEGKRMRGTEVEEGA
ncbi:hypothetical protein B0H16DRAFT_1478114 [Mycena metata]|uniref:Uncharacterized protein n=1 Tax=Mycena metata TaxID=1033252 RepID=A0AAD7H8B1_9AGAR|nr:hypothetical protein B0H16DRAFT_1478114 [Mycena metata]